MSRPTQEDLIGYLLGALEQSEHEQINRALESDETLKAQLRELSLELQVLDESREPSEQRPGLAERTCRMIDAFESGREYAVSDEVTTNQRETLTEKVTKAGSKNSRSTRLASTGRDRLIPNRGWSASELGVAAAACILLGIFFFPSILSSRNQARIRFCQNNLRSIGYSLYSYADLNRGRLPRASEEGKRSFAGMYAIELNEQELLESPSFLLCPSAPVTSDTALNQLPKKRELDEMADEELMEWRRRAGGSYAYALGYYEGDSYQAPVFSGSPNQVIMADAPNYFGSSQVSLNHGKYSQNVLAGDLSVRYVKASNSNGQLPIASGDPIFVNRIGIVAAGVDEFDAVLGRSEATPHPAFLRK